MLDTSCNSDAIEGMNSERVTDLQSRDQIHGFFGHSLLAKECKEVFDESPWQSS